MTARDLADEAQGWRRYADALAAFVLAYLVNRIDVWGGYWPLALRDRFGKPRTAPSKVRRGLETLNAAVLARHFRGEDEGDVVGLHTTATDNTSRSLWLDFDAHGEVTDAQREAIRYALGFCVDALGERVSVLIEDSDGGGGFHAGGYFDAPVPTDALYAWLQRIAADCYAATGIKPETYPKQAHVLPGGFGSWLRLPGRHHTRPHWSRVCRPGDAWASGADAAHVILHDWPATPADVVPPLNAWPTPTANAITPRITVQNLTDTPRDRATRIANYVSKLPHGNAGSARSDKLFHLARWLRHGMFCTDAEALPILHAWDAGNTPPLGDVKVRETWKNAGQYASQPVQLREREGIRYAA